MKKESTRNIMLKKSKFDLYPSRWYLGAFHAGRKSDIAKKPFNPIIGEIFQCYWHPPKEGGRSSSTSSHQKHHSSTSSGKKPCTTTTTGGVGATDCPPMCLDGDQLFPWVENPDAVIFFGEQVSHHPPISAFYAECVKKQISLNAHIWTKSKFLGLSIGTEIKHLAIM